MCQHQRACLHHHILRPTVTMIIDLQNLTKSSVLLLNIPWSFIGIVQAIHEISS